MVNVTKHGWKLQVTSCGLRVACCGFGRVVPVVLVPKSRQRLFSERRYWINSCRA